MEELNSGTAPRVLREAVVDGKRLEIPQCVTKLYLDVSHAALHASHFISKAFRYPKKLHAAMPFFMEAITPGLSDPFDSNTRAACAVSSANSHISRILATRTLSHKSTPVPFEANESHISDEKQSGNCGEPDFSANNFGAQKMGVYMETAGAAFLEGAKAAVSH